MSRENKDGGGPSRPVQPDDKGGVVITPAGPVPEEKVHPVGPGEIVRRNKDGNLHVIPKSNPKNTEGEGAK